MQEKAEEDTLEAKLRRGREDAMDKGGWEEGLIRMVMALEDADHVIDPDALYEDDLLLVSSEGFEKLKRDDFLRMARDQSSIFETDEDKAFKTPATLIPGPEDRARGLWPPPGKSRLRNRPCRPARKLCCTR